MRKDAKYATPRDNNEQKPTTRGTVVLCLFILALFAIVVGTVVYLVRTDTPTARDRFSAHDSLDVTRTYDGEMIRWYVFTDPDSGAQYLVNDRGGVTPRLDGFGNPKGTQYSDQSERGYD